MRTVFKNFLVLAVMLGTFTSFANEMLEVTPTFNYVTKGNYISVSDAFGEVIYSGEINYNGNLTTLFDFTQLRNGKYDVEVTNGYRIDISTIEVKNNIVSVTDANRKTIFKPIVRNENFNVLISKLALDGEKMEVELFYEGDLIYSEIIGGGDVLNRVYKLDETLKGSYTTIIKSNDRVFVKNFRI